MPDFLADVLSRSHNRHYRLLIQTAKSWKVPPTQIILGEPMEWSHTDSKLSTALVLLEEETCKDCGTVAWHGHSGNRYIKLDVDSSHCYGCQALEERREDKERKMAKGEKPYVKVSMYGDLPLPSRQDEFDRRAKREK